MKSRSTDFDYLIIGGGFYGCCLALFLRTVSDRILLVESGAQLMERASRVNQARIHTGFHYPRSSLTAVKSMLLHRHFMTDFPDAVVDDFQMLYAVARRRSKVSARRFLRMFQDLGAPIRPASPSQTMLFDPNMVEGVFACSEAAFDYTVLRRQFSERLARERIDVKLSTSVAALADQAGTVVAGLTNGQEITSRWAFNVTYSRINSILDLAALPRARLKHELAEIALVEPPTELAELGVTVMDGPFFSCMPYPPGGMHSLTHVRYTPHRSWTDSQVPGGPCSYVDSTAPETHVRHMILDGQRYLPSLAGARYVKSIYEVKTVLQKNEQDDGRPILYQQRPPDSRVISILGGKLDNIYDLFELVKGSSAEFAGASDALVVNRRP
jgi:glycine/D-amino acid oxidase-like deaminating enzyme